MEKMTKTEMVEFLREMTRKQKYFADEKKRLPGTIETIPLAVLLAFWVDWHIFSLDICVYNQISS